MNRALLAARGTRLRRLLAPRSEGRAEPVAKDYRGEADDGREADIHPDEAGVSALGELVRVEDPGRECGERADPAAGDDRERLPFERGPRDYPEREGAGEVDRE